MIEVTVSCDHPGCSEKFGESMATLEETRTDARVYGWATGTSEEDKDFCRLHYGNTPGDSE